MSKRTTLTLEDDVAERLREETRRTGKPFKSLVNELLRAGLDRPQKRAAKPFRVQALDLGLRPGLDIDDIEGLIEQVEGPDHR
ncbi:MAG: DUF2191 domain-containing protein [Actinomycetota bacterium]